MKARVTLEIIVVKGLVVAVDVKNDQPRLKTRRVSLSSPRVQHHRPLVPPSKLTSQDARNPEI